MTSSNPAGTTSSDARPSEPRPSDAPVRFGRADFERLLAAHYREQGWQVEHCTNAHGIDRGIDFKLRRQNEFVLVHCKHWNALQVPMHEVNGLIAAMAAETATGAMLICGGEFSPEAKVAAARQTRLRLIDGAGLREMVGALPELPRNRATFKASAPPPAPSHSAPSASRVTATSAAAASRAARSSSPMQIGGGLVFLGLLIAGAIFVYGVMNQVPSPPPIVVAPPPAQPAAVIVTEVAAEEAPPPKPTIEVPGVDDAPPQDPASQPPPNPEAEAREAQRRAEEAMKVIESNTPEI